MTEEDAETARTLATILDPEGNLIGLASHTPNLSSRRNNPG
jgi:hypothetical protein